MDNNLLDNVLIHFGDKENSINKECYENPKKRDFLEFLENNKKKYNLDNLIFLKQIHSPHGIIISNKNINNTNNIYNIANLLPSWQIEADYIITDLKNMGIGVLTADCLPIMIIDQDKNISAIIHAGWRGTLSDIIENCVNNLIKNFKLKPENLKAYLGPSAKSCCYEVQEDFLKNIPGNLNSTLKFDLNKIYFDLPKCAQIKLIKSGINPKNISLEHNMCTVCNPIFCSSRNKDLKRQINIIAIKIILQ